MRLPVDLSILRYFTATHSPDGRYFLLSGLSELSACHGFSVQLYFLKYKKEKERI